MPLYYNVISIPHNRLVVQSLALQIAQPVINMSMSTTVQQLYTVLLYFLQTALHVSDDTLIHHQEHTQTVITTTSTGRTVFATFR